MINIAIIGAGYMALEHIKSFQSIDGCCVKGIMGRSPQRAQLICKNMSVPICARSVDELYEKTNADAVVIAVNEMSSPGIILKALEYDWIILAEKPLGIHLQQVLDIQDKQKINKRQIYAAMNRRHYPSTRMALELLNNNRQPRFVEVHDQENIIAAIDANVVKEVVESWMVANSIHLIDYFNIFCRGSVNSIQISKPLDVNNPFCTSAFIEYDSGDTGLYVGIWNAPGPWGVKVTTKEIMLEMRPLEHLEMQKFPSRKKEVINVQENNDLKPGLLNQAKNLILAIKGKDHSLPSLSDYLKTHNLIRHIYPENIKVCND